MVWTAAWSGEADLRVGQRASLGDQDLAPDEVDAGDHLGDGVLDLDPRVDLDEEELAGVGIDQELDGPGVVVARPSRPIVMAASQMASRRLGSRFERRGDLDDLLVPPLDRAVPLEQVDEVAVPVAEELDLDVLGLADELFEEDVGAAEGGLGLATGLVERRRRARRPTRRPASPGRRRPSRP